MIFLIKHNDFLHRREHPESAVSEFSVSWRITHTIDTFINIHVHVGVNPVLIKSPHFEH